MRLHSELRAKIKAALAAGLPELSVTMGHLATSGTWDFLAQVDQMIPHNHKPKSREDATRAPRAFLTSIIDDQPLVEFAYEFLDDKLQSGRDGQRRWMLDEARPLKECLSGFDAEQTAEQLLGALEALPYPYTFTLPLPAVFSSFLPDNEHEFRLNKEVRLVRVSKEFEAIYPGTLPDSLGSVAQALAGLNYRGLLVGDVALQIDASGFASRFGDTETAVEATLTAKAFVGLCIALTLVSKGHQFGADSRQETLLINRMDTPRFIGQRPFDYGVSHFLRSLTSSAFINGITPEQRYGYARSAFATIGRFLELGEDAKRLRLAGRWFFDSSASGDEVTAFVQAMIVLETLLGRMDSGERDALGLGELLRNRCAYLLGKTRAEREGILEKFPAIYRIRSAIVHRGQPRLSSSERELLYDLRYYCARAIRAEGELLLKGAEPAKNF